MEIGNSSLIIYPEYHLSDFPPQTVYSQPQAKDVLKALNVSHSDIILSGYVENCENNNYSSCLIMDQGKVFNLRKKYPYSDEIGIIAKGDPQFHNVPLSIGNSYFFICNDITFELEDSCFHKFVQGTPMINFFFISAMGRNFDKWLHKLKDISHKLGVKNIIYCDRFNGKGIYKIVT